MSALLVQMAAVAASPGFAGAAHLFSQINGRKHNVNCWLDELAILHHFVISGILTRFPVFMVFLMSF